MIIKAYKAKSLSDFNTMNGKMLGWMEDSDKFLQSAVRQYSADQFYCEADGSYLIPIPPQFDAVIDAQLSATEKNSVGTFDSDITVCNFPFITQQEQEDNDKDYDSYAGDATRQLKSHNHDTGYNNFGKLPAPTGSKAHHETEIVGTKVGDSNTSFPYANFYDHSIAGTIIPASALGNKPMLIKEIAFRSKFDQAGGMFGRNLTMYMAHTKMDSFKTLKSEKMTSYSNKKKWEDFIAALEETGDLHTSSVSLPGMSYFHMKRVLGDNLSSKTTNEDGNPPFEAYFPPVKDAYDPMFYSTNVDEGGDSNYHPWITSADLSAIQLAKDPEASNPGYKWNGKDNLMIICISDWGTYYTGTRHTWDSVSSSSLGLSGEDASAATFVKRQDYRKDFYSVTYAASEYYYDWVPAIKFSHL